jgi:hypothetical protein
MYYSWRTSYQGWVGIPLAGLTPPYLCVCLKPGSGFPMSYVVLPMFGVQWVKARGGWLFCWKWKPSLFKLSFHNNTKYFTATFVHMIHVSRIFIFHNYTIHLSVLNRHQHFIVKHNQNFPTATISDICASLVALNRKTSEISKRKWFVFHKLCIWSIYLSVDPLL